MTGCIQQATFAISNKNNVPKAGENSNQFIITCKDFRSLYFSPSEADIKKNSIEPFMCILNYYAFASYHNIDKNRMPFALLYKDPSCEGEALKLDVKDDYRRMGAFTVRIYFY
jgi:hypothetical protein